MQIFMPLNKSDVALFNHSFLCYRSKKPLSKPKRKYGCRNHKTFSISVLDFLGANRIFARLANESEGKLGADIIAHLNNEMVYIKLNPANNPINEMELENKNPSLVIVNTLEELTIYFGKKLSQ